MLTTPEPARGNTTGILLQQLQLFQLPTFTNSLFIYLHEAAPSTVHTVTQSNTVYDLDRPTLVLIL